MARDIDRRAEKYRHTVIDKAVECPACGEPIVWHYSIKKRRDYPCNVIASDGNAATYSRCDFHPCRLTRTKEGKTMTMPKAAKAPRKNVAAVEASVKAIRSIIKAGAPHAATDIQYQLAKVKAMDVPGIKQVLTDLGVYPADVTMGGRWRADATKAERLKALRYAMHQQTVRPNLEARDDDDMPSPVVEIPAPLFNRKPKPEAPEGVENAFDAIRNALKDKLTSHEIAEIAEAVALKVCVEKMANFEAPEYARPITVQRPDVPDYEAGCQHENFGELLGFLVDRKHVWAWGPAATGKTRAAEEAAKALKMEFYPYSVGPGTMPSDFVGFISPGTGLYQETIFRKAFEHGGLFLLDEADTGSSAVMTKFNAALSNKYMAFPDRIVHMHEDFVCMAAANTQGQGQSREYSGRIQLDGATLDRFVFQQWCYDAALERTVFHVKTWCGLVQEIRRACEALGIKAIVSMRATQNGSDLMIGASKLTTRRALECCVYKSMDAATCVRIETWITDNNNSGKQWDDRFRAIAPEVEKITAK